MRAPPFKLPQPDDLVGDYRVVECLGDGGFSFVYRVERAGRAYALKLIRARELERWGQREIDILRRLKHRNVVRFRACDRWPDPDQGSLYFVMDLVEGRTLEQFVRDENPSAHQVAGLLLEVALALAEIEKQGVLHRDLKRENILIREADGRPVLVDFGIGWMAGAPTITGEDSPPGTDEYRTPEYVRFEWDSLEKKQGAYRPDVGDELWALGVTLYWLLTDELPFGTRNQAGLYHRILTHMPPAPHERNPRVPPALSALCMRMLRKDKQARFADYAEWCGALDAALAGAGEDARWGLPLMDPDDPDATPTQKVPGMGPPAGEEQLGLAWVAARPRRGHKARWPQAEAERDDAPLLPGPAPAQAAESLVALLAEVAPERAWEALPPPVPESSPPAPPAPVAPVRGPLRRALSRVLPTSLGVVPVRAVAVEALRPAALGVVVLGLVALASGAAWVVRTGAAPGKPASLPAASRGGNVTNQVHAVREVANSLESSEAGKGAARYLAPIPVPVFATMLRKEDSRVNSPEKSAPQPQRKGLRARVGETCVTAACCAALGGCASTPPARPTPKPEECPPGAVETMTKMLDIDLGDRAAAGFPVVGSAKPVTVREFTTMGLADPLGKLRAGTGLSGRLYFGEDRVYGRFTQARLPSGETYQVCLELTGRDYERGAKMEPNGGPDSAVVISSQYVTAVRRFE